MKSGFNCGVAEVIVARQQYLNITDEQLASKMNISPLQLFHMKSGNIRMSVERVVEFATALQVSARGLFSAVLRDSQPGTLHILNQLWPETLSD